MSNRRNFPDDFFDHAEDDPILGDALRGASESQEASGSARSHESGESVFAPTSILEGRTDVPGDADAPRERAILVTRGGEQEDGLDALNTALDNGWTIKRVALMSGNASHVRADHFSALVVLKK